MCARVAVMADIDLERRPERRPVDFVGAQCEHQFGSDHRRNAIGLRIAEHQPAHACRRHVEHVEAVPASRVIGPHQLERLGQRQRRAVHAVELERTTTQDDHGPFRSTERVAQILGQLGQNAEVGSKPLHLIGKIGLGSDGENLRATLDGFAHAGVHQRRFPTQISADKQDDVRLFQPGDRRVEIDRRQRRTIVFEPGLPPFEARGAQLAQQRLCRIHRLTIDQIACDCGHARPGIDRLDRGECRIPACCLQLAVHADIGLVEPLSYKAVDGVARLVRRPFLVHILVDARQRAQHLAPATVEPDIGANGIHHVDRRRLAQFPGPRLERVGLAGQRPHRTQINHIARQFGLDRMFQIGCDLHVLATPDRTDVLDAGDFLGKTDAARALDAPRHRRLDDRPHVFLGDRALVLVVATVALAIGQALILEVALAALVADRAVEWVVDEQELHHPLARLLHHRAVGADHLPFGSGQRTRRLRLGRTGCDFDEAHAAIARDAQPLVVAETRNFLACSLARLEHSGTGGDFNLDAVDREFRHLLYL